MDNTSKRKPGRSRKKGHWKKKVIASKQMQITQYMPLKRMEVENQ
jgi:hypothetical protein